MVAASRAEVLTVVAGATSSDDGGEDGPGRLDVPGEIDTEWLTVDGNVREGLLAVAAEQSVGVITSGGAPSSVGLGRLAAARFLASYGAAQRTPLLIARSGGDYTEIMVPARRTSSGEAAARAAIDLAVGTGKPLVAVAAVAPAFVATGTDTREAASEAAAWLREEAAVHGLGVEARIRQGNPVRVIAGEVGPGTLLVMGSPRGPIGPLRLGVTGLAATRVPCSVLLVPRPT